MINSCWRFLFTYHFNLGSNQRMKISFGFFESYVTFHSIDWLHYRDPYIAFLESSLNPLYILSAPSFDHYLDTSRIPVSAPLGLGCHWPRYSSVPEKTSSVLYHTSIIPFQMGMEHPPKKSRFLLDHVDFPGGDVQVPNFRFTTRNHGLNHSPPPPAAKRSQKDVEVNCFLWG